MRLETSLASVILRRWTPGDEAQLVAQANDREVWRNLTDTFPHPYTQEDAAFWVSHTAKPTPSLHLCIEVDGVVAGGIGIIAGAGLEEKTGQFGYWLGQRYWGKGIATAAAQAMLRYAVGPLSLTKLQAPVFAWNPASMRVLEKIGFHREDVLHKNILKDGELVDTILYAYIAGN